MKSQVLAGIHKIEPRDVIRPKITRDTEVLLKVEYIGVCGSDIHYFETGRIGSQIVKYPFTVGHECAATVVETGPAVHNLKPDQKVVVEPAISCHRCDQCKAGRVHTCRKLKFLGCPGQVEGCLCEYIVMPQECCYPIDNKKITLPQGVLCEPLAIGVYAVQLAGNITGQRIGILGCGPIGLCCFEAARAAGAEKVYMTEKLAARIKIAQKAGADWVGNPDKVDIVQEILQFEPLGLDVVIECAGQQETLDQAAELLKPGGKLLAVGIPREDTITFRPDVVRRKEILIQNVRRQNHCTQKAIELIAEKKIKPNYMITHEFEFSQAQQAFELVSGYRDGVIKALIKV